MNKHKMNKSNHYKNKLQNKGMIKENIRFHNRKTSKRDYSIPSLFLNGASVEFSQRFIDINYTRHQHMHMQKPT